MANKFREWMATLECPPFKAPNKMKLIGTVNGVKVEMSYDSLCRIAKFDSKSSNQYIYPSLKDLYHEPEKHPQWQRMLDYLFVPDTTHGKLLRSNLRIEAKLMLILCTHNVIPRRGDKMEKDCSHCRLITALLKKSGAIGAEVKGSYKRFKPFDIQHLGSGWEYKESERYHKLKTKGKRWRALKVDARPLRPGEADEPETSDEEVSGDDDYREDTFTVDVEMEGAGPSGSVRGAGMQSGYVGSAFD
ncbi:hypothetical protein HanPI659440_Chr01g0023781 [Helianthus annuus]|nr:hypothetical protein HanPI659440_Chr01g0023781 [Helianthus annuus]